MKTTLISFALCCLTFVVYGQQLGDPAPKGGSSTNKTIISKSVSLKARKFFPVMKTPDGSIVNEGGIMGDVVTAEAIKTVAENADELSEAAHTAMTNAMEYIHVALKNMATNSVGFAIAFAPDNEFSNLTFYVAHEESDGRRDRFWIWMNREIGLSMRFFMTYKYYGGEARQPITWEQGWNRTVTVTDNRGREWEGCHIGVCDRPDFAVGKCCITEPNLPIGGPNGFNLGGITLIDGEDNEPYYTGEITNEIDKIVIRCEDGVIKEVFSLTAQEEPTP